LPAGSAIGLVGGRELEHGTVQLRVVDLELAQWQDLSVRVPHRVGVGIRAVGQDPADQRALLLAD
jgi:hypothetical protein